MKSRCGGQSRPSLVRARRRGSPPVPRAVWYVPWKGLAPWPWPCAAPAPRRRSCVYRISRSSRWAKREHYAISGGCVRARSGRSGRRPRTCAGLPAGARAGGGGVRRGNAVEFAHSLSNKTRPSLCRECCSPPRARRRCSAPPCCGPLRPPVPSRLGRRGQTTTASSRCGGMRRRSRSSRRSVNRVSARNTHSQVPRGARARPAAPFAAWGGRGRGLCASRAGGACTFRGDATQ
jgi:hypothetical protein